MDSRGISLPGSGRAQAGRPGHGVGSQELRAEADGRLLAGALALRALAQRAGHPGCPHDERGPGAPGRAGASATATTWSSTPAAWDPPRLPTNLFSACAPRSRSWGRSWPVSVEARVAMPGGCNLGPRKIDFHLRGLAQLGADGQAGARLRGGLGGASARRRRVSSTTPVWVPLRT